MTGLPGGELVSFRLRYGTLRDRVAARRRQVAFLRALWLGLLAAGGAVPAAVALSGRVDAIWIVGVAFGVWFGAVIALIRPASGADLGRRLDRLFRLDDLLVTALEVDRRGPASDVEARLLDDAGAALAEIAATPRLLAGTVRREAETVVGVACLTAGLWLLLGGVPAVPGGGLSGARPLSSRLTLVTKDDSQAQSAFAPPPAAPGPTATPVVRPMADAEATAPTGGDASPTPSPQALTAATPEVLPGQDGRMAGSPGTGLPSGEESGAAPGSGGTAPQPGLPAPALPQAEWRDVVGRYFAPRFASGAEVPAPGSREP